MTREGSYGKRWSRWTSWGCIGSSELSSKKTKLGGCRKNGKVYRGLEK